MKRGFVSRRVPERKSKLFFNKWVLILLLIAVAFIIFILLFNSSPPQIISASVYPEKVMPGQVMLVKAEARDNYGIASLKALIETDDLPAKLKLVLVEGTSMQGNYEAAWLVRDTSAQKWYNITITATNIFGKTATIIIPYQDPTQSHNASEIVGGTFTGNYSFMGGNIGIGTTSPSVALEVSAPYASQKLTRTSGYTGSWTMVISQYTSATYGTLFLDPSLSTGDFVIRDSSSNEMFYLDTSTGNVGIGTTGPSAKLEVNGSIKFKTNESGIKGVLGYDESTINTNNGFGMGKLGAAGNGFYSFGASIPDDDRLVIPAGTMFFAFIFDGSGSSCEALIRAGAFATDVGGAACDWTLTITNLNSGTAGTDGVVSIGGSGANFVINNRGGSTKTMNGFIVSGSS